MHRPLNKNSATTGNKVQRERMQRLMNFPVFKVKAGFSVRIGVEEKEKILCTTTSGVFIKTNNATGEAAVDR